MLGEELKQALTQSKIRIEEFSDIAQVHRTTVYWWVRGRLIRQRMTAGTVQQLIKLINKAIALNLLPIKSDIVGVERLPAIKRALRKAHSESA